MKKKLKEKQLKKMMKVSSKVLTMSAVSLLLSGSPLVTLTALAAEPISVMTETDSSPIKEEVEGSLSEKTITRASVSNGRPMLKIPSLSIVNSQMQDGWGFRYDEKEPLINIVNGHPLSQNGAPINNVEYKSNSATGGTLTSHDKSQTAYLIKRDVRTALNRTLSIKATSNGRNGAGVFALAVDNGPAFVKFDYGTSERQVKPKKKLDFFAMIDPSTRTQILDFNIDSYELLYTNEWNAIDDFFANQEHTVIFTGIKASDVAYVQGMVDALGSSNKDKVEMQQELDKVWSVAAKMKATTISPVTTQDTVIKGTGEPGAVVTISKAKSILVGTGMIDASGNYSIPIAKQPKDVELVAVASLANGRQKSEARVIVTDKELAPTTLNALNSLDGVATGTGEPNATIIISVNNAIVGSGAIGSDGKYSVTIPKQTVGTVVKAVAKSGDTTSNEVQVIVSRGELELTTLSDITTDTTTVSGTGEPNGRIELKVGSTVIGSGTVSSDGKYSLTIPKQTVGSIVKAIVSKDGLTSEAQ
ncbi:Ig-like domain-containing protein, partial [Carnobacterium maltaromaticum]|uniref:Ig-like domain-containing protein n=1 Tax=Carnobacterium maltaromaticum TaxID=2751 RepID=UPI001F3F2411